ncbi:MAG: hypothetical protein IJI92_03925 [Erysipelotrichaceae bacterium]|nr:hypothetical protein [Erysipelotrichaceae bacterium]
MENNLTPCEEKFYGHLKKQLFLSGIEIRTKISLYDLCMERSALNITFGNEEEIVKDIIIDFVLYKKDRVIAGIEVLDEPNELEDHRGENLLKDLLFGRMSYEYFKVTDMDRLNDAAKMIRKKLKEIK